MAWGLRGGRGGRRLPASLRQLQTDERLLLSLLAEICGLTSGEISSLAVRLLSPASDITGNLSDSGRIQVSVSTYAGHKTEYNWFVKIKPDRRHNSDLLDKFDVFKNEIEFYKKIAPSLRKFVQEFNLEDDLLDFDIPELIFAAEEGERAMIILEDLVAAGYGQQRDKAGNRFLSREKASVAAESIARIQAVSYAFQIRNNVDLGLSHPTLETSALLWTHSEMTSRLLAMKDVYCDLLKQSKKSDSPILLKRFLDTFDSEESLKEICKTRCRSDEQDQEGIFCLQQGDFHFNNLLFKEEEGRVQVKIVDWQLAYNGSSGGDITYLLMSSIDPTSYDAEVIKDKYVTAFLDTFNALVTSKVGDFNIDGRPKQLALYFVTRSGG